MRSIFLALTTATSIISSLTAYAYSTPDMDSKELKMWSHIVDPYGHNVAVPEQIRWEVDAATCGSNLDTIVSGMHSAEMTWRGISGIDIQRAVNGDKINLAVYCTTFSESYSDSPTAYRVRYLETGNKAELKRIAVEVPSNWTLVESSTHDEVFKAENAWWSARGTAHYVIGLSMGLKHAYASGKQSGMYPLDDAQRQTTCIKRCDPSKS
jgi:hypothetical protein